MASRAVVACWGMTGVQASSALDHKIGYDLGKHFTVFTMLVVFIYSDLFK